MGILDGSDSRSKLAIGPVSHVHCGHPERSVHRSTSPDATLQAIVDQLQSSSANAMIRVRYSDKIRRRGQPSRKARWGPRLSGRCCCRTSRNTFDKRAADEAAWADAEAKIERGRRVDQITRDFERMIGKVV
jgi:hypothetical protein